MSWARFPRAWVRSLLGMTSGRLSLGFNRGDRFWLTRHYVALSTLASVVIALSAPGSLNARALAENGLYGWALLGFLSAVALLLLFEAFTTAFVAGMQIGALRSRRHTLLMLLAVGHLSMGFLIVTYAPASSALVVRFGLDATVATVVAFLDLFQRDKADRCSL